ncbi:MAG: dipeptidyl aminopeptidase/acylaminoacyl peptidase [Kiritimatiellia bacterium]|jgi:dipeptidyl aminopeptidase/acylaminoacyl peptidase
MTVPLLPRDTLFGNPDRATPQVSPCGQYLAYLGPDEGVLNLWIAAIATPSRAKVVTQDRGRGIRSYQWAFDGKHVLYVQDEGGDENWRVRAVSTDGSGDRDLTPIDGVQARIQGLSREHPGHVLIALNDRNEQLHDLHRVDISTGDRELVEENPGFIAYVTDQHYKAIVAIAPTADGGMTWFRKQQGAWTPFSEVSQEDSLTTFPLMVNKDGDAIYVLDSRDRDTAAAWMLSLATGERELLAEDDNADVSDFMVHPTERRVQAVASTWKRTSWKILDEDIATDLAALAALKGGEVEVLSRDDADTTWTVALVGDDGPIRYYLWNRAAQTATFLFLNRTQLEGAQLAPMQAHAIATRDGLDMVSYLTEPLETDGPNPMVLLVHGGPWARDEWGYNPYHQWLANRGYAVLSVNFRGSTGFGKRFTNAGDLQWSAKMHDDLLDAVQWAVERGTTTADKVCIMGGSYGGYATLVGLTFTPDVFACGVDIVGPSNLITLIETIPPYWAPVIKQFTTRVGDNSTEEGRAMLMACSPISKVNAIERPLLIGQGANDPRVKQAESDQIVTAMQSRGIPVTYVLFPDEGHGFARPENNQAFMAVVEAFLAEHLGGRAQVFADTMRNSSATVPHGAAQVPGLADAIG